MGRQEIFLQFSCANYISLPIHPISPFLFQEAAEVLIFNIAAHITIF